MGPHILADVARSLDEVRVEHNVKSGARPTMRKFGSRQRWCQVRDCRLLSKSGADMRCSLDGHDGAQKLNCVPMDRGQLADQHFGQGKAIAAAHRRRSTTFSRLCQQPGQQVEAHRRLTVEIQRPGAATRTIEQIDLDGMVPGDRSAVVFNPGEGGMQ
jgi:hypothetical protein